MLLAESEKYGDAINAIKKDIVYMPIELKKNLRKKNYIMNETKVAFIMVVNFKN